MMRTTDRPIGKVQAQDLQRDVAMDLRRLKAAMSDGLAAMSDGLATMSDDVAGIKDVLEIVKPVTRQAIFSKATNQIECANVVSDLGLEVGDVIGINGADNAGNNKLFTVEDIAGTEKIVVNFEHRNGKGTLSLQDETKTVTIKRIAKWYNAPLGLGQAWVWVDNRGTGTITNSTNRTIGLYINANRAASGGWGMEMCITIGGGSIVYCDLAPTNYHKSVGGIAIIPPGSYSVSYSVAPTSVSWKELR